MYTKLIKNNIFQNIVDIVKNLKVKVTNNRLNK